MESSANVLERSAQQAPAPSPPPPPATVAHRCSRRSDPLPKRGTRPELPLASCIHVALSLLWRGPCPNTTPGRWPSRPRMKQRPPSLSVRPPVPVRMSLECRDVAALSLVWMSRWVRSHGGFPKKRLWRIFAVSAQAGAGRWADAWVRGETGLALFRWPHSFSGGSAKRALTSHPAHSPWTDFCQESGYLRSGGL